MKRILTLFVLSFFLSFALSACSPTGHVNILLFTDKLNDISGEAVELSDYTITDKRYRLLFEQEGFPVLLTAEENDKGEIKRVNLSFSKVDEKGKALSPEALKPGLYLKRATQMLFAFTLFDEEICAETAEKILPLKSEDFLRTGELTLDYEYFHLVYYSNKICCRFSVTNTFLEKTEVTEKPVSKPFYEVTANIAREN